jgi:predicted membrane-bound spermidine synthase
MARIFVAYALSGFVSLGYQVAWFRIFTDWFGSTTLTFGLVVCNFIGGLGIGALLSDPMAKLLADRLNFSDRLRVYGAVELLVALSALLTVIVPFIPVNAGDLFTYELTNGIWQPSSSMQLTQTGAAVALVLIPCFFMGVTFPLLCHIHLDIPRAEVFPSALYGWNTLGACTGVLACQFILLPIMGHELMFVAMAAINLLLGGYFVIVGGAAHDRMGKAAARDSQRPAKTRSTKKVREGKSDLPLLIACGALSGLLAGSLEGDAFKRITFAIEANPGATMSFISFWAILAIFLGSTAVRRFRWCQLRDIKVAYVVALAYYVVIGLPGSMDSMMAWLQTQVLPAQVLAPMTLEGTRALTFPSNLLQLLVFVGALIFPSFFLISLLLPYVCNRLQAKRQHLGLVYGLNTLAFCVGLIAFTLVAPLVNIFYSLKLFPILFALVTLHLIVIRNDKQWIAYQAVALIALIGTACILIPSHFDRYFFRSDSFAARYPVHALKSDANHTTFVIDTGSNKFLYFGRLSMSGTNGRSQAYMRLMAHFPLLAQRSPKSALLICFGIGNTASAIAAHDSIERIDIVDLNAKVFETAPEFARWNDSVHLDPRVRLIHDDGRHYLKVNSGTYDLITSEPPPPMAAGVYRLYSKEYYENALGHLSSNGMMTQWLPVYQMPPEAVTLAIRTFINVFPNTLLITGYGTDFILVGSRLPLDPKLMEDRLNDSPGTTQDLKRAGINDPIALLGRIIDTDEGLRERYTGRGVIRDQHNDLERLFLNPSQRAVIGFEPLRIMASLGLDKLGIGRELQSILMHFGRLRYRVPGFPFESLANTDASVAADIALGSADWVQIGRLYQAFLIALDAGEPEKAAALAQKGLELGRDQPEFLINLAKLQVAGGNYYAAITTLTHFQQIEPEDATGRYLLGSSLMPTGQPDKAIAELREAARLDPNWPAPLNDLAWILATHPDRRLRDSREAIRLAEQAVRMTGGRNPLALDTLSAAYAADGQFVRAADTVRSALKALDDDNVGMNPETLTERLRLYETGKPFVDQTFE